ncbi:MAG: phage portal protein [Phycicoccus sp.]
MTVAFIPNLRAAFGVAGQTKQLVAAIESKSLAVAGYESVTAIGGPSGMFFTSASRADGWDMERAVTEYERSVWAFRCIELMASRTAGLKYAAAVDRDTDEQRLLEASHPIHRVLNKRANPLEVGRAFKKRVSAQVNLSKKGVFVEVGKTNMGTLNRVDLMLPQRVHIEPSNDGTYIKHFEYFTATGEPRELAPERVRWIREPHPTDPFSGVTPLEAAGLSVQLDMLSRLYNVSFIQNDARPGGILAVDASTLSDREMDRLGRKFRPGAHHAGELEVIASGGGGLNYIDTTTRPRDMAYAEAAQNAKEEVLAAFGIGESVLGNASGRTYDNADAELYGFWTGPMWDHLELIASAFDQDIPEEYDGYFDTSHIPALELPKIKAREEARIEFRDGLRSADEYRPLAGLDKVDVAQTRALWVSPAKAPVPTRPEDRAALGLEVDSGEASHPPEGDAAEGSTPEGAVEEARALNGTAEPGSPEEAVEQARDDGSTAVESGQDEAALAVDEARQASPAQEVRHSRPVAPAAVVDAARMERKSLDDAEQPVTYDAGAQAAAAVELAVAAALEAMLARQSAVTAARVEAPKSRQGTRFWAAAYDGDPRVAPDGDLDAEKIVNTGRWLEELTATLGPVLAQEATKQAEGVFTTLDAAGLIASAVAAEVVASAAASAASRPVLVALSVAHDALTRFLDAVVDLIRTEGRVAASAQDVSTRVRERYAAKSGPFARSLATDLAGIVLNAPVEAAASALVPAPGSGPEMRVVKTWRGIPDASIRDTHRAATGQTVALGESFTVGASLLAYPGDPAGPPSETRGCRCRVEYRWAGGQRLLLPPT